MHFRLSGVNTFNCAEGLCVFRSIRGLLALLPNCTCTKRGLLIYLADQIICVARQPVRAGRLWVFRRSNDFFFRSFFFFGRRTNLWKRSVSSSPTRVLRMVLFFRSSVARYGFAPKTKFENRWSTPLPVDRQNVVVENVSRTTRKRRRNDDNGVWRRNSCENLRRTRARVI